MSKRRSRSRRSSPVVAPVAATTVTPTPTGPPLIPRPPFTFLRDLVPEDRRAAKWTYRDHSMNLFYNATGEKKYQALKNVILTSWPTKFLEGARDGKLVKNTNWNPWMDRLLRGFTNEAYAIRQGDSVVRVIGLTGCASASKSHVSSLYAVAWWMIDPENSIAVITSTTKDMIRSRIWSVVREYATSVIDAQTGEAIEIGQLKDSQMKLCSPSGDPKHSIGAYAVAHGETLKAIDNLKGLHAKRMLVIIDEANSTPEGIFNVIPNYKKGCQDLTIVIVGNPVSRLDSHGRALKPELGWPLAMDEKVIEWKTEGVPEWELDPGLGMRFDGRDSPNVAYKHNYFPYLYRYENWLTAQKQFAESGGNFAYWSQSRGMWPGDGMSNIIFSEQLFIRCDAIGTHFTFDSEREILLFVDTAFGGDGCIAQFASMGNVNGRQCIQLLDWMDIPIDPSAASHDIDYQIARWIQTTCITRKIKPECVGLDATGTGRGVGAILASEWSPKIHYTTWGQGATDRPSAQNDGRPAREVYATFVTELWFSVRELLEAGQILGFSRESISEFCSRQYVFSGKKYKAEPKDEMRLRLRYSPDHADAVVGVVEVARRLGLTIDGKITQNAQRAWDAQTRVLDQIYGETSSKVESTDGGWAEEDVYAGVTVDAEAWDDA